MLTWSMPLPLHCRIITSNSLAAWHSASSPASTVSTWKSATVIPFTHSSSRDGTTRRAGQRDGTARPFCTCCRSLPSAWSWTGAFLYRPLHSCAREASYLQNKDQDFIKITAFPKHTQVRSWNEWINIFLTVKHRYLKATPLVYEAI